MKVNRYYPDHFAERDPPSGAPVDQDPRPKRSRIAKLLGALALGAAMAASDASLRPKPVDIIVGDGGNVTVYKRPNGSQYALDSSGRKAELPQGTRILGPAKFDSRSKFV